MRGDGDTRIGDPKHDRGGGVGDDGQVARCRESITHARPRSMPKALGSRYPARGRP